MCQNNMEKEYCISTVAALFTDLGESKNGEAFPVVRFSGGCLGAGIRCLH